MSALRVFRLYQQVLHEKPYTVQCIQTASLMMLGDALSQTVIEKQQLDLYRVAKFGSIGLILGPALTTWYRYLHNLTFKSPKLVVVRKIAIDQLCFAPTAIGTITTLVSLGDGKTIEETKNRLNADFFHILQANYKLWPFVQYVNFSFVPLDYRVLVTQLVAVGWNTYLAWKLNANKT